MFLRLGLFDVRRWSVPFSFYIAEALSMESSQAFSNPRNTAVVAQLPMNRCHTPIFIGT
jgi:hypothetical protein